MPASGTAALATAGYLAVFATNDTVTVYVEGGDPADAPCGHEARAGSVRLRGDGSIVSLDQPAEERTVRIPESGVLSLGPAEALVNPGDSGFEIGRVRTRSRIPLTPSRYVDAAGRPLQTSPRIEVSVWTAASWLTEFNVQVDT